MSRKSNGAFQKELLAAQRAANFTVADLARWFQRPHATVRCWTKGTEPSEGPLSVKEVKRLTNYLAGCVARRELPLPRMPRDQRMKKLEVLRKRAFR